MILDQTLREFLAGLEPGRRLRVLLGWQASNARKLGGTTGIPNEYICKFMHGDHGRLRGSRIRDVCKALEVPEEVFKELL